MKNSITFMCVFLAFFSGMACRPLFADTYYDYQNYNHGYVPTICPNCGGSPCKCGNIPTPPAPMPPPAIQAPVVVPPQAVVPVAAPGVPPCAACGDPGVPEVPVCAVPIEVAVCEEEKPCGISMCALGIVIAAVAAAAAIIVSSGNGSSHNR